MAWTLLVEEIIVVKATDVINNKTGTSRGLLTQEIFLEAISEIAEAIRRSNTPAISK